MCLCAQCSNAYNCPPSVSHYTVDAWLTTVHCATTPTTLNGSASSSPGATAVLVLAHGARFVTLYAHWDATVQRQRYQLEHCAVLPIHDDDSITAVACLPIAAFQPATGDWTCVAVGFASGCVRFYGAGGADLLATQQWHAADAVQQLKVQSPGRHGLAEELHVFHASCVCIVPGGGLVQMLRNRNSASSVEATTAAAAELLPCRKWTFGGSKSSAAGAQINDAICVGSQKLNAFDHLLSASREGGFFAQYKSAPPQNSLVLGVGVKPFAGFHWAREGLVQPVLADVARAVARHIKSALPTWLTGSGGAGGGSGGSTPTTAADAAAPQMPPAEPMHLRFGLCDLQRIGLAVWLAPDRQHAAVVDNLGRVMLVDCFRGIAVRVWKGYRDAQCGFVQANEKLPAMARGSSSSAAAAAAVAAATAERRRHAMFLVIYAPKRACLECWLLQRGPRVAAFSVPKGGRLLSSAGAAVQPMGAAAPHHQHHQQHKGRTGRTSVSPATAGCVFVDGQTGEWRELVVPFHCALSDAYARTSKDLHLMRRIKLCVRNSEAAPAAAAPDDALVEQEVRTCCEALQTDEVRVKCVEMLVRNAKTRPQVLRVAVQTLLEQHRQQHPMDVVAGSDSLGVPKEAVVVAADAAAHTERLLQLATDYLGLVDLYTHLSRPNGPAAAAAAASSTTDDPTAPALQPPPPDPVPVSLSLTELENIEQFVTLKVLESGGIRSPKAAAKVTFNTSTKSTWFADYLAAFESTAHGPRLRTGLRPATIASVGEQMFGAFVERGRPVHGLTEAARASRVCSEDLMRLLLAYWLDRPFVYTQSATLVEHLGRFSACVQAVCRLAGVAALRTYNEYNAVSDWWQQVREQLLETGRSLQALLAAMMCRALAERLSREADADDVEAEEVWEQVPQEAAEWSLLVDKLDDVAVLALALGSTLQTVAAADEEEEYDASCSVVGDGGQEGSERRQLQPMPVIQFGEMDVSLAAIVCGGKGIVSEMVARWIISLAVGPEQLVVYDPSARHETSADSDELAGTGDGDAAVPAPSTPSAQVFSHYWQFLRGRFPFSLQSGCILAHMAWEYFCHWSKHMANMALLQAALRCLAAMPATDQRLKHGLCCMIWNAHLKIPLQATSKLINKTGRLPTEALCMQDIGLSAALVADLLEHSGQFWAHFAESGRLDGEATAKAGAVRQLRHEELLQDGPVALAQLAVEQAPAASALLRLHSELIQVLFVMAALNLRLSRPVQAVFDAMSMLALFSEINRSAAVQLPPADAVLQRKRTEFLLLAVSATMDSIRVDLDGAVFLDEHVGWMERVQRLSAGWSLNADELRRHQIAELYAHGWDEYAGELVDAVLDVAALGVVLLRIAGRRLKALLQNEPRMYAEVASVGSVVTDFLDVLVRERLSEGVCEHLMSCSSSQHNSRDRFERVAAVPVSLDRLIGLSVKAFTCLAETEGREKRVAAQLFDACQRLKELELNATES